MAKFQIFYKFENEAEVEANSEKEALDIARDIAYQELKHNGDYEVTDIYEFD